MLDDRLDDMLDDMLKVGRNCADDTSMSRTPREPSEAPPGRQFPGGRVKLPSLSATMAPERGPQVAFVGTAFVRATPDPESGANESRGGFQEYFTYESLFDEPEELRESNDPYVILGMSADAEWTEIVVQHRHLARQFHPDRFVDCDEATRQRAEDQIRRINWAYNTLSDRQKAARS